MNTALRRLATVVVVMFLALLAGTTWVQFGQASALNNDSRNVRTLYREYGKPRGPIIVAGQPVAQSTAVDDPFGFQRSYSQPELYSTVTGFYSVVNGGTQLERSMNDVLTGQADSLFWTRIQDLITGAQPQGSSIELTLDPAAQQAALDAQRDPPRQPRFTSPFTTPCAPRFRITCAASPRRPLLRQQRLARSEPAPSWFPPRRVHNTSY